VFAGVRGADGRLASLAFGAVHDRTLCVNLVVTDPPQRRAGLARRAVTSVLSWARERMGAESACLAVVAANAPAVALYRQLGFTTELYRYHYRRRALAQGIDAASRPAQAAKDAASA
jgi:N-acetylglutamate synthase